MFYGCSCMYTALPGEFAGCLLPSLAVRRGQTNGAATLVDGNAYASIPVIRDDVSKIRVLLRIRRQSALQIGIVGVDLHHGIGLVEIDLSEFILLFQNCTSVEK